jgi:hypothetical protein
MFSSESGRRLVRMWPLAWLTIKMTLRELIVAVGTGLLAAFTCLTRLPIGSKADPLRVLAGGASDQPF